MTVSLMVHSLFSLTMAASAPTEPVCNEVCVYYANRGAATLADQRGAIRNSYRAYSDCVVGLAKSRDWAKVAGAADAQSFLDESWTTCAAARESGDRAALAIAQQQVSDPVQARRAVDEKRAMDAYILASVIFQKAGRGGAMTVYVTGMRAKMAPDLERK